MPNALALCAAAHRFNENPNSGSLSRKSIANIMDAELGSAWNWRSAYDAIEAAGALQFGNVGPDAARLGPNAFFDLAGRIQTWAPTQTIRTQTSQARELFSTPPIVAAASALLLQISAEHSVLEPSAGTGGLAGPLSAFSSNLWLNELNTEAAQLLHKLFPHATISARDASVIDALTDHADQRFDRCAMNPPFKHAEPHLRAAFSSLRPGGALVAVLPARFRDPALIQRVVGPEGRIDLHYVLDARLFAHAGVSTETVIARIQRAVSVADRISDTIDSVADLRACVLAALDTRPLASVDESRTPQARTMPTVAASAQRPVPAAPRTRFGSGLRPPLPGTPVAFDIQQHPDVRPASRSEIYAAYQPSRLTIANGRPHTSELVESVSMASVPLPPPTHHPVLPTRLVTNGILSTAQLEAVVYAGQAHNRYIPGRYTETEAGHDFIASQDGSRFRYGFFLGDATGVGKGRTIAGIIMDNLCQGRTCHLWVTESAALIEDARRDWVALGGRTSDIVDLKAISANVDITVRDGIFFVTYATLRRAQTAQTRARLDQVLELLGPEFDGVIIFDEAHAMGAAVDDEGDIGKISSSQTGRVGLALQNALPDARIVYASATGASHVRNIAYATRLGLWGGPDTPFTSRADCLSNLASGGPAALELLVRELKGRGLFMARSLSLAGIEYAPQLHAFTSDDEALWNTWSDVWTVIHTNLQSALETTGISRDGKTVARTAKAAALSAFESTKLRFLSHLLQAIQAPSLIASMEDDIARGEAPIVQLTSTNQAVLDRRLRASEGASPDDLDFTPREYVIDYLERAFPTARFEPITDDTGEVTGARPMRDTDGNTVQCPQAAAAKAALLERLHLMPECLGVLDQLMAHFGPDRLSECTGRTRRLLYENGRRHIDVRGSNANTFEASRFMSGATDTLVFSTAGGTGRSYHASLDHKNQRRRVHYLAEAGWRADKAVQGLGRSHRTHQASAPRFRVLCTDLAGQKRFVSTISQRLETLGAFTKADRRSAGEQLFSPLDNLDGEIAQQAYHSWCYMLAAGKAGISLDDFQSRTGLAVVSDDGQLLADRCKITRWLNRLLALPVALQNSIFEEFFSLLEAAYDAAAEHGDLDREIHTLKADKIVLKERHELPADEEGFLPAFVSVYETTTFANATAYDALNVRDDEIAGRYVHTATGKPVLATRPRLAASADGSPYTLVTCITPTSTYHRSLAVLDRPGQYRPCDDAEKFKALWKAAEAEPEAPSVQLVYVLHGACLHLWRSLSSSGVKVRRIQQEDGATIIGRLLQPAQAHQLVEIRTKASVDVIVSAIAAAGLIGIQVSDGTYMTRTLHMNRPHLQVHRFDRASAKLYTGLGGDVVIHNYSPKLLVPWSEAAKFIAGLQDACPGLSFQV